MTTRVLPVVSRWMKWMNELNEVKRLALSKTGCNEINYTRCMKRVIPDTCRCSCVYNNTWVNTYLLASSSGIQFHDKSASAAKFIAIDCSPCDSWKSKSQKYLICNACEVLPIINPTLLSERTLSWGTKAQFQLVLVWKIIDTSYLDLIKSTAE